MKASCLCILLTTSVVCGAVQYTVTDLGSLGSGQAWPTAINNHGQVVGASYTVTGATHAFLYDGNGPMRDLGTAPGEGFSYAWGINDGGQVVGAWMTTDTVEHAFLYSNGSMQDLPVFGANNSWAFDINNGGQIAGIALLPPGGPVYGYSYSNGQARTLGLPTGTYSRANAINDNGQIVGVADTAPGESTAFLYSGGHITDLGSLGSYSEAYDINNNAHVVGSSYTTSGYLHAFLYDTGGMHDLGTLGGIHSEAYGINECGQIVGYYEIADRYRDFAFVYDGSTMTDLNSLIDPSLGWTLTRAVAINDSGQIIGHGFHNSARDDQAFLLTPIPEPSTLLLMLLAPICNRGRVKTLLPSRQAHEQ